MKKLLIRNQRDYEKVISFIKDNNIVVSDIARDELLGFPEKAEYSMVVAYKPKENRFFAGEHDMKFEVTEWANSFEDLFSHN